MYYIIIKGSTEPIVCSTWHDALMTMGEMQRLGLEAKCLRPNDQS
jgi:hypothetical protein